jgi:hypothetical protein
MHGGDLSSFARPPESSLLSAARASFRKSRDAQDRLHRGRQARTTGRDVPDLKRPYRHAVEFHAHKSVLSG